MEFTATVKDLKKTMSIVALAVGEGSENITGHALFDINDNQVFLYATDNDKMGVAYLPVSNIDGDNVQFTVDPKRIQKLISGSNSDTIKFVYDKETKTLNVYASENSDSFVSFASFEPENFLSFDKDIQEAKEIKTVDATIFLSGIKFIQGFLPDNDTNKKYSNLYLVNGTMYGSNGSFKVGAFEGAGLQDTNITIRRAMLSAIGSLIDLSGSVEIMLSETEKITVISTKDQLYSFAFRKVSITPPKFPLSIGVPESDSFNIDRSLMLKKLNRLSLASKDEVGIKMVVNGSDLSMETIADRKSYEKMTCKRLIGDQPMEFVMECNKLRSTLGFFEAPSVDVCVDKTRCIIYSKATVSIKEEGKEPVSRDFTAVGLLAIAKVL